MTTPIIKERKAKTLRSRDGLIQYARNDYSQGGEDGILEKIFTILDEDERNNNNNSNNTIQRWCVDVGAWDGKHLSNTYMLLNSTTLKSKWSGVLIEADVDRCKSLKKLYENKTNNIILNYTVSCEKNSDSSLVNIIKKHAPTLPTNLDFLSIDIDGADYWVLVDVLENSNIRPKLIVIEFNPTMPDNIVYVQPHSDEIRHGSSLRAFYDYVKPKKYTLIETTIYNAFFIQTELYEKCFKTIVADTSIEALHEVTMGTTLYQLYDGTIKIAGCKKLLWHRLPIREEDIQILKKKKERSFPFIPPSTMRTNIDCSNEKHSVEKMEIFTSNIKCKAPTKIINLKAFLSSDQKNNQKQTSENLLDAFGKDGFAIVTGTRASIESYYNALKSCKDFFLAPEYVRRSTLAKDYARRGYSPSLTENFASLIGSKGPNDSVRKFRIGPPNDSDTQAYNNKLSVLFQPNIWPSNKIWTNKLNNNIANDFKTNVIEYYNMISTISDIVLNAICKCLPDQSIAKDIQNANNIKPKSSILTLLGYKLETISNKSNDEINEKILVAPHTDVSVLTILIYDGDSAILQRQDSNGIWQDVIVNNDNNDNQNYSSKSGPKFVVNIGDCLSDMSGGLLKSTLHRVIRNPKTSKSNTRSCLAFFLGFASDAIIKVGKSKNRLALTFEEWRKQRIQKAMSILKNKKKNNKEMLSLTGAKVTNINDSKIDKIHIVDVEIYIMKYENKKLELLKMLQRLFSKSMQIIIDIKTNKRHPAVDKFIHGQLKNEFGNLEELKKKHSIVHKGIFLVAHNEKGAIIGMVAIEKSSYKVSDKNVNNAQSNNIAVLKHMCVSNQYRSKGIGTRLLRTALNHSLSMGYLKVHLDTIAGMKSARKLYIKHGFQEISRKTLGLGLKEFTLVKYSIDLSLTNTIKKQPNVEKPLLLSRFDDYLTFFKEYGYVVIPNILSPSQIDHALNEYDKMLLKYGIDIKNNLVATAKNARKLSSTHGAGGILDLFYPKWKIDLTLNNQLYYLAYLKLLQGTYGSYASSSIIDDYTSEIWSHPYKIKNKNKAFIHIDRIGCRFPDDIVQSSDDSNDKQFQRGLAPHMDCCPKDINGGGGKQFPRWRPIQCLLSLTSTMNKNEGGFECVPKFHKQFKTYYENKMLKPVDNSSTKKDKIICVGDFTPMRDPKILEQYQHIPIPAGAALFWDQRLPHANSFKNNSNKTRRCIYGGFLPYVDKNTLYAKEQLQRFEKGLPQVDFWMKEQEGRLFQETIIEKEQINDLGLKMLGV